MLGLNITPNVVTFSILVDAACKEGQVSEAQCIFKIMVERGVEPDTIT